MEFNLFTDQLQDMLRSMLPSSADVETTEDDGCPRIFLRTPSDFLTPGIPLERFYEEYRHGCTLNAICSRILEIYAAETLRPFCTAGDIADKSFFLRNLELRPLSLLRHKKLMPLFPHEVRSGILFFFTAALCGECEKLGGTLVTPELLHALRLKKDSLFGTALSNMKTAMPSLVAPLSYYLDTLSCRDAASFAYLRIRKDNTDRNSLFVLTNSKQRCGACSLFYPGLTEDLYGRFGPYYILPSSVHEVLILPAEDAGSIREMKNLIRSVNASLNDTLLILSDELYAYDPEKGLHIVF